jgi:hypothetical protein
MSAGIRKTLKGLLLGSGHTPVNFACGDVAALGTNQGTAAELVYVTNNVTDGNGTKCVRLPVPRGNPVVFVYHSVATVALPVYPHSGGTIAGGSANAAVDIEGKTLAIFICTDGTNWGAIYTVNT